MKMQSMMLAGLMAATTFSAMAPAYAQQGDGRGWNRADNRGEGRGARPEANRQNGSEPWQAREAQARIERGRPQVQPQVNAQVQTQPQVQTRDFRGGTTQAPRPPMAAPVPTQPSGNWRQGSDPRANGGNWNGGTTPAQPGRWVDRRADDRRDDHRDDRQDNRRDDRQDARRDWRQDGRQDWRDDRRDERRDDRRNDGNQRYNGSYNGGYTNAYRGGRLDDRQRWEKQRRWNNDWRNDRRYDWQSYRSRYGDTYRLGRYYAPRGWNYGYRSFSVGIYLNSLLYSNNYWLDDPYAYRLPPAYGTLRWVRYYDDALLVDIRDGYVVDVIRGFFY